MKYCRDTKETAFTRRENACGRKQAREKKKRKREKARERERERERGREREERREKRKREASVCERKKEREPGRESCVWDPILQMSCAQPDPSWLL